MFDQHRCHPRFREASMKSLDAAWTATRRRSSRWPPVVHSR